MRLIRPQSGYSLIELAIYSAISALLLMALTTFFSVVSSAMVKNQTISEVDQQGTLAMDYITQTIRNADSISSPAAAASSASLTLTVPTSSLSPTVFDSANGVLETKEVTAAYVPLTNSRVAITGLTFKNLSRSGTPGVIQVSFTLSRVNTSGRNEFNYTRTFTNSVALR